MKHTGEEKPAMKFSYLYKKYKPFCGYFGDSTWSLTNQEGKFME